MLGQVEVDYNRSSHEVSAQTGWRILEYGGFRLLYLARHRGRTFECPSWVPDWSSRHKLTWNLTRCANMPKMIPMSSLSLKGAGAALQSISGDLALVLTGKRAATVVRSSPSFDLLNYFGCTECQHWFNMKHCHRPVLVGAFSQFVESCAAVAPEFDASYYYHEVFDLICTRMGPISSRHLPVLRSHVDKDCDPTYGCSLPNDLPQRLAPRLDQRHLILTDNGKIGCALLDSGVEPGDLVVRLDILEEFFALRPIVHHGENLYKFLGWLQFDAKLEWSGVQSEEFKII